MDNDVEKLKFYLKNHKIVIYVLIVFLAMLTYLTIIVDQQLSGEQALQGQSKAYESFGRNSALRMMQQEEQQRTTSTIQNSQQQDDINMNPEIERPKCPARPRMGIQRNAYQYDSCTAVCFDGTESRIQQNKWYTEEECQTFANTFCGCKGDEVYQSPTPAQQPNPTATPTPTLIPTKGPSNTPVPVAGCRGEAFPYAKNSSPVEGCYGNNFNRAQIRCYTDQTYEGYCNASTGNACYDSAWWQAKANELCCSGACQEAGQVYKEIQL